MVFKLSNRCRFLNYIYTVFHHAHTDGGSPVPLPLWLKYHNAYGIDYQFGDSILVLPVTQDEATSVGIYLPTYRHTLRFQKACVCARTGSVRFVEEFHFNGNRCIREASRCVPNR